MFSNYSPYSLLSPCEPGSPLSPCEPGSPLSNKDLDTLLNEEETTRCNKRKRNDDENGNTINYMGVAIPKSQNGTGFKYIDFHEGSFRARIYLTYPGYPKKRCAVVRIPQTHNTYLDSQIKRGIGYIVYLLNNRIKITTCVIISMSMDDSVMKSFMQWWNDLEKSSTVRNLQKILK